MTHQGIEPLTFISLLHLHTLENVIIYMKRKLVQIIGGSASTAYALDKGQLPWPDLISKRFPELEFKHNSQKGLTFIQAINLLSDMPESEIVIFHFGTSIGWPIRLGNLSKRIGFGPKNEFSFQQPPKKYTGSTYQRLLKLVQLKIRNTLKYFFFIFGKYRPRTSIMEVSDQIDVVLKITKLKFKKTIWIQHKSLPLTRTLVERRSYDKFYTQIIKILNNKLSDNFILIQLPEDFLKLNNYLLDGVHLTAQGHKELAELIEEKFSLLLFD